ncbi:MAG: undecaprenyl-diphosphate phosphatase [Verrucomicrobiia bacterium]
MADFLDVIFLGLVEGITEFLPISSTAHLLIAEYFLGSKPDAFNVMIQFGAVMAVILIYWERLKDLCVNFREPKQKDYLFKIFVALMITIIGCLVAKRVGFQLPITLWPIVIALWLGSFAIFVAEKFLKKYQPTEIITWNIVIWVGISQILAAVLPGTSRSGATIIAAMLCGLSRVSATEFSFLLGVPTMLAASLYMAWDAYRAGLFIPEVMGELALGFVVSMITAFIAVKWLLQFVRTNNFIPFAWYRVVLSIIIALVFWREGHTPPDLNCANPPSNCL